jgi:hypothetical protein
MESWGQIMEPLGWAKHPALEGPKLNQMESKWREIRQARYARLAHCIWGPPVSGVSAADSDSDSGFTVAAGLTKL